MSETDFPLPPATFAFLTTSIKMQAEMQLGLVHFGEEKDRPEPDFRLARHSIDMLAMLEEKTRGNLEMEEKRHLENSLTELRFRYIGLMEQHAKKQAEAAPAVEAKETPSVEAGASEAQAAS